MTSDERTTLYRVAYDEAVRALASQQVLIESLRARAGLLLSAAAVTTSFLGSQALDRGEVSTLAWVALLVFAASSVTCLAVLWPRRWELVTDSHAVIRIYFNAEPPPTVAGIYEDLSLHLDESLIRNKGGIEHLVTLVQVAGILLSVDAAVWAVAVAAGA